MLDADSNGIGPERPDILSAAPSCPGRAVLRPLRQTTLGVAPHRQFDMWRDLASGLVEYALPAERPASYEVDSTTWRFGNLALLVAETPSGLYRRSAAQVRRDGVDHWAFTLARSGRRAYRTGETAMVMEPGRLHLHTLGQPFEAARTQSSWLHFYVPRDAVPPSARTPAQGQVMTLDTPGGRLLRDHLLLLAAELPRMAAEDAERMASATHALVDLALSRGPDRPDDATPAAMAARMVQIRAIIRAQLGSAMLGPARLCRVAGISRSQLYRLFAHHGGVALYIQRERLNAAYRALSDPADERSVAQIGEDVGLFDPSSFSRMFRHSFGLSPRELRSAARTGSVPTLPPGLRDDATPTDLNRLLLAI